jgi:hypothetical protein
LLNVGEDVMTTGITRCVKGLEERTLCASAGETEWSSTNGFSGQGCIRQRALGAPLRGKSCVKP